MKRIYWVVWAVVWASCNGTAGNGAGEDTQSGGPTDSPGIDPSTQDVPPGDGTLYPAGATETGIVFVSRQRLPEGSIYWRDGTKGMPGVGAYSRFKYAGPSKLLLVGTNGTLIRTLVDGTTPTAASLNIVDVNAPDVDWEGKSIVFAGLVQGKFNAKGQGPEGNAEGWRLFVINVDGTGLRQLTNSDMTVPGSQFGMGGNLGYDDTDPAWLPYDGRTGKRVVFVSSRWFAYGHYSGVRATNLFVVNADGTGMHRITSERNSSDRPQIDPVTGKIVYARWWRNHRFPSDTRATKMVGDQRWQDGLTTDRSATGDDGLKDFDGRAESVEPMFRNAWHAATINPDGTALAMWSGFGRGDQNDHMYGGAFLPGGDLMANYYPLPNMTEQGGFGGLRILKRGANRYTRVAGISELSVNYVKKTDPPSFNVLADSNGLFVSDPTPLPNGRIVVSATNPNGSATEGVQQDYDLYTMKVDGSDFQPLFKLAGSAELRARVVAPRVMPPVRPDLIQDDNASDIAKFLPPAAKTADGADVRKYGTFTFTALNVYGNAPVDSDIISAIPVGTASKIRFFMDHQRTSSGSFPLQDWPILLGEKQVTAAGFVEDAQAPAGVPLFEQIRSSDDLVPMTGGRYEVNGAAHVAGMNFGKPGVKARCIGCHTGHTMIAVPPDTPEGNEAATWSNLAPGADATASTNAAKAKGVVDRRVLRSSAAEYWASTSGQTTGQWVKLTFRVPVRVKEVVLYNPKKTGADTLQVAKATVRLFGDPNGSTPDATGTAMNLTTDGTTRVSFDNVRTRTVQVLIDQVSGQLQGQSVAALAEIEVIARGD